MPSSVLPDPNPSRPRKLVVVVTEDWFLASHFLPMVRAAGELGLEVAVVTRVRDHRAAIEACGAKVIALQAERRSLNPLAAGYAAGQVAAILQREKADLVHCIALRSVLVGGAAARIAGVRASVFALTGLGFLGARSGLLGRSARQALRLSVRSLATPQTQYLFENPDDPALLGLGPQDGRRVTILGGAGVDPDLLIPAPLRPQPPLRVAVVARMLWSKGIDLAVEAVRMARGRGVAVELSLFGAPDASNPKAVPEGRLAQWAAADGVAWYGATSDVPAVWAAHHVCCLASRGGEGLPRTLLEAAACGRAIVTTDVPGCRTLVRDGIEGIVVPPNDPAALARAFERLAADPAVVARMGVAARARILEGFTERQVMEAVKQVYARLLRPGGVGTPP